MHACNLWVMACLLAAWVAIMTPVAAHSESSGSSWLELCKSMLTTADTTNGIYVKNDSSCLTNATQDGCFLQICRYCRVDASTSNEQSRFYPACNDSNSTNSASSSITESIIDTNSSSTSPNEPAIICSVSQGDAEIGLSVFYDETCPGIGCIEFSPCRFCKMTNTTQNSGLEYADCPLTTEASAACSSYITMRSVSSVTDSSCNKAKPRLVGCVAKTSCRLCRTAKTMANQKFVSCQVLQDQAKTTTSVTAYATAEVANAVGGSSVALIVIGTVAGAIAAALLVAFVMRRTGDSGFDPLRDGSLVQIIGKERIAEL